MKNSPSQQTNTIKTLSDLAPALSKLRLEKGLDQADMKMLIGMGQQQYQSIEKGSNPTITTLLRILEGLEVDLVLVPRGKQDASVFSGLNTSVEENIGARNKLTLDFAHLRDDE